MRRVHLFLGLCGIAVAATTALVVRAVQMRPEGRSANLVSAEAEEQAGSSASPEPAVIPNSAPEAPSARTPAEVGDDPCASLTAELEAERAARTAAEQEAAKLRKELAELTRELNALKFPEDTPYGAFLASPEAEEITDLETRRAIKAWLDEFPVFLRPGEATWIAARDAANDWQAFGRSAQEALVYFLGPSRLAEEMPLDKLLEDYLWDEDYGPRLQASLPPEKRAELEAKLHGLMAEVAGDPEEVAWLLEKFPSFFD